MSPNHATSESSLTNGVHPTDALMKVPSFGPLEDANCGLCDSPDSTLVAVQHQFGEDFRVVHCNSCGMIRTNPRPTAEWKAHFYDPQYNRLPETFGRDFIYAPEADRLPSYRRLLEFVKARMKPGGTLIDVGAASGDFVNMAVDDGIDATACDYSREALLHAEKHYNLKTLQSPAESIDAPDDSFDVVTMFHTIEHLPDPLKVLREMYRILKPDGLIFLETPNYNPHYLVQTRLRGIFPLYKLITKRKEIPWVPFDHYYHWTPPLLRRALQQAGFRECTSHHMLGYRSNTKPNLVFWMAYVGYDVMAQAIHMATGGREDHRLVQLASGRK
jgi:ubiquinone/menaquinone biosynthesis C-methylase UbiE